MNKRTEWTLNFSGWILFTLSAIFFIWNSLRAQDMVGLVASVLFLLGCIVFLVPVWLLRNERDIQ